MKNWRKYKAIKLGIKEIIKNVKKLIEKYAKLEPEIEKLTQQSGKVKLNRKMANKN